MIGRQHAWTAMTSALLAIASPFAAMAQTPQSTVDDGSTFSATMIVTNGIVDAKGVLVRQLPTARYRLSRRADGRLHMTALADADSPATDPMTNRYAGMTVQHDPSTGGFEVRDRNGVSIGLPAPTGAATTTSASDSETLVATTAGRAARRAAIERAFGQAVGRLRGLDRFVERSGARVRELLVSPETALPRELNVAEGEALVERHIFDYAQTSSDTWVRRRSASEALLPGTAGQRMVAVTTLDDLRIAGGGGR